MPAKNDYKPILVAFMAFKDNTHYERDTEFTVEQLGVVQPTDVVRWMQFKAYGVPDPGPDARPTLCRSSSLAYWKKALSKFMPNKLMQWNALAGQGNPTKSSEVNDLIAKVKKCEVRRQGKKSSARRATKPEEYKRIIELLEENPGIFQNFCVPALIKFQFHMISRIDDASQFLMDNLTANDDNDFTLRSKLNWSKNVREERDAPNQIVIGAMDSLYCVLIGLAVWLEIFVGAGGRGEMSPFDFGMSDDFRVPEGGEKVAKKIQEIFLKEIFCRPEFSTVEGPLGSHSLRKQPSTHARKNGCNKDEKEIRGRWKSNRRIADVYDDIDLPYPDAKVAGKLCIGGPCKYSVKAGSGVTDGFILQYVVPAIATRFPEKVSLVLGKALLWFAFSDEQEHLPTALRERIHHAYTEIQELPDNVNPVEKLLLVITGNEGEVFLDEVVGNDTPPGAPGDNQANRQQTNERNQMIGLISQVNTLRRDIAEVKTELGETRMEARHEFQLNREFLRRTAIQPAFRRNNNTEEHPPVQGSVATLSPNPKNLFILWQEYEIGLGGRKAAKLFTREERGRVKHKYSRRKVVWDCISNLVRAGLTAHLAIDRIHQVYGEATQVTVIINSMKRDRIAGVIHPLLHA
jgi:regulator of replication initiation timing